MILKTMTYVRVSGHRSDFSLIGKLEWSDIHAKWRESCSRIPAGDRPIKSIAKLTEIEVGVCKGGRALKGLLKFIDEHQRKGCGHIGGFEAFKDEVRQRFIEAEREFIGDVLKRLDMTLPEIPPVPI